MTAPWMTVRGIVGLPYSNPELLDISEVRGGSPYGGSTLAGPDGSRQPTDKEFALVRAQGRRIAEITKRLCG
jgi:NAD(P)H dehydrogenase (quinone)